MVNRQTPRWLIKFGCGHEVKVSDAFLETVNNSRRVCPDCWKKEHEKKVKQQDESIGEGTAITVPYWQYKIVSEYGIKQVPKSYNRYKQTTKIVVPKTIKHKSITGIMNSLLADKIESQIQYANNKKTLRAAVEFYRNNMKRSYSDNEIMKLSNELKMPFIFNPDTVARISKDLGMDITKNDADAKADDALKRRKQELAETIKFRESLIDSETNNKEREQKKRHASEELRKITSMRKQMTGLISYFEKYSEKEKKVTTKRKSKNSHPRVTREDKKVVSKKRKTIKNQKGYKKTTITKKGFCVPETKQSYWKRKNRKFFKSPNTHTKNFCCKRNC